MGQRVIACKVIDDYITGDGVTIGGAGSHTDVLLELDFRSNDTEWANTTRTVTFTDALGTTSVNVLLTTELLTMDSTGSIVDTEVYRVPVPVNVKRYPGWITVGVTGVEVDDGTETVRIATGAARFRVLPNDLVRWSDGVDVPASAAEQLQSEIDEIKDLVGFKWAFLYVGEDGYLYEVVY